MLNFIILCCAALFKRLAPMPARSDLLDIAEAAAFLQVSPASLRRWTNAGLLACYRIGGRRERRFRQEDLLAFLESHSRSAPAVLAQSDASAERAAHLCSLYASERERTSQIASFLAEGLDCGAVCFLGATRDVQKRVRRAMGVRAQALGGAIASGHVTLFELADEPTQQLEAWRSLFDAAVRSGARSLCAIGDVSGASFARRHTLDEVLEFEATYDRTLAARFPVASLCLYDARRLSGVETARVLSTHTGVLNPSISNAS